MKKFVALVLVLLCLVSSASADMYCTWGKVVENDDEGNAVIETVDGHLFAVYDDSLRVGVCLALVFDDAFTNAYNDDSVVDYVEVEATAHPNLWKL